MDMGNAPGEWTKGSWQGVAQSSASLCSSAPWRAAVGDSRAMDVQLGDGSAKWEAWPAASLGLTGEREKTDRLRELSLNKEPALKT